MTLLSGILLIFFLLLFAICHSIFSKRYKEFFEPLDSRTYSYKAFLPGCLGIVETLKLSGRGRYQAKLNQKLVMLYGSRYITYYTKVHWSVKVFHLFLGLVISTFFCFVGNLEYSALIIIPVSGAGLFFLADKNLDDLYKERKFRLERDFPDFLSKLVLLVNAGLNIRQAIERIVSEENKDSTLYEELKTVILDIQSGMLEYEAYSGFSERCRIKQLTNFVSIVQQNMKLGGNQMIFELKRMGTECWEMRKNIAKQLGEKASSKLMLPLAIMFLAIVLICVAPVILELRSVF